MALTDENMVMPVSPMGFGNFGNFGGWGNGFGGDGWWVILFLFAMMGNGFGGWGGFGNNWGMADGILPYFYNTQTQNDVNRGFDTQNLGNQIASVQGSVDALGTRGQLDSIQNSITNGFASQEVASCNRFIDNLQTQYQNQIADMNQRFSLAVATDDRIDNLAMALQKCCCDNELAIANTNANLQAQAAENRFQAANNTRDIITNATANTQAVLDKLCQLELDGVRSQLDNARRDNVALQNQLNMANLAASQTAQTAALMQDNTAQTAQLIQRIAPYPTPSFIVGNPYGYAYNTGYGNCGCGCNGNGFGGIA